MNSLMGLERVLQDKNSEFNQAIRLLDFNYLAYRVEKDKYRRIRRHIGVILICAEIIEGGVRKSQAELSVIFEMAQSTISEILSHEKVVTEKLLLGLVYKWSYAQEYGLDFAIDTIKCYSSSLSKRELESLKISMDFLSKTVWAN